MIALWMLHALVVGALLALAAAGVERALRLVGRPGRWAWALALALTVALPAARLAGPRADAAADAPGGAGTLTLDLPALPTADARDAGPVARAAAWLTLDAVAAPAAWRSLDLPLALLWMGASLLLATRTAGASRRLSLNLRRWPREAHAGTTVHVAPDLGPAVFGALRPAVIVPRWALADARLPLMLAHEDAHVRARDPLLLAAGLAAALLVPWNLAAWWQLRRLRLAVELDCDARVLAAARVHPPLVRAYGALLLDVAHRAAGRAPLAAFVPTLLATPSTLSRRIHAMTTPRPRRAVGRALALTGAAAALVAAACELPRPTGPRAAPEVPLARVTSRVAERVDASPLTLADIRAAVVAAFPGADARARGATQRLWVVQDGSGRVSRVMRGLATRAAPGTIALTEAELAVAQPDGYRRSVAGDDASGTLAGVSADGIATVDVRKLAPGQLTPDSTELIWTRLKGADVAATAKPARAARTTVAATPAAVRIALRADTLVVRRDTLAPKPLYLVDGVEFAGAATELPKPERIESVEVLKGAAAERAYGARGAHGVIVITTKRD